MKHASLREINQEMKIPRLALCVKCTSTSRIQGGNWKMQGFRRSGHGYENAECQMSIAEFMAERRNATTSLTDFARRGAATHPKPRRDNAAQVRVTRHGRGQRRPASESVAACSIASHAPRRVNGRQPWHRAFTTTGVAAIPRVTCD